MFVCLEPSKLLAVGGLTKECDKIEGLKGVKELEGVEMPIGLLKRNFDSKVLLPVATGIFWLVDSS